MTADVRMKGFRQRTSLADALALIERRVGPLGVERVPFNRALGRVLAEDVISDRNVPPHPKSAMDGYAVRSADLPGTLDVVGQIMAADAYDGAVGPGQAVGIMTGARVPEGADTVVMVELTKLHGDRVTIDVAQTGGTHVLATGEDLTDGATVLATGRKLRPQDLSMLVSVNSLEVTVRRRPRVRLVPTGSELVRVGTPAGATKIVESNSFMLEALAHRDGAEPILHPIVRDDIDGLKAALTAPGADLVVMTGGSSVGKEDLGPVVMREIGELPVHGVHMKPGSPTGIGFLADRPVVLAPGYPVASFVAWDMLVRPIVQRLGGAPVGLPYRTRRGRLAATYQKPEVRVELQRVMLEGDDIHMIRGGAALLSTTTRATGFVLLEAGRDLYEAGTELEVHLYE